MCGREGSEGVDHISTMLASGKNVVTPSYHALFRPPTLDEASRNKLEAACRQGNSSLLATGIAPGFATDIFATHAASMTELTKRVAVEERIPCGAYRVPASTRCWASDERLSRMRKCVARDQWSPLSPRPNDFWLKARA
jgi:hypothetical protein